MTSEQSEHPRLFNPEVASLGGGGYAAFIGGVDVRVAVPSVFAVGSGESPPEGVAVIQRRCCAWPSSSTTSMDIKVAVSEGESIVEAGGGEVVVDKSSTGLAKAGV